MPVNEYCKQLLLKSIFKCFLLLWPPMLCEDHNNFLIPTSRYRCLLDSKEKEGHKLTILDEHCKMQSKKA